MRPNHLTLFLLTLLLLAACVAPAGGPAPIPTPTLLPAIPPNNGLLYIELPPAADPTVTFTAAIIDSTTDVPVVAVYPLEDITTRGAAAGRPAARHCDRLHRDIAGSSSGRLRSCGPTATGEWNVLIWHRAKTSRRGRGGGAAGAGDGGGDLSGEVNE